MTKNKLASTMPKSSEAILKTIAMQTDTVVMAFSAGKDSCCAWILASAFFKKIIPIWHYIVPNLEFQEKQIRFYEDFFETEIIRLPHPLFMKWISDGVFMPPHQFRIMEWWQLERVMQFKEMTDLLTQDMGYPDPLWTCTGVKAADSPVRSIYIRKCGGIEPKQKKFHPCAFLKVQDIEPILLQSKCKLPSDYDVFGRNFDGIRYRYLNKVKELYPSDYAKILEWFPLVEMEFIRKDIQDAQAQSPTSKNKHHKAKAKI